MMDDFIFGQLKVVRANTINAVRDVSEPQAVFVPEGFNNNILWNLGHVYLVQERFAFGFAQEPLTLPPDFVELFGSGSKPADWKTQPPKLSELLPLLESQTGRIKEKLGNRLDEAVPQPLTMSSGLTLKTVREFLTFSIYHEGMHVQTVKMLKRFGEK